MPLFSIIVPVYNTEKYLCRCVESVLGQTYNDFELILVDDGSTDSSFQICEAYAKQDERIKVVHKSNGGVSSARNVGMEKATGKYIWFVDSDDYIESESLRELKNKVLFEQYDLYIFNTCIEDIIFIDDLNRFFEEYYFKYIPGFEPWNKLYSRKIIEQSKLKFDEEETIGEDLLFNIGYYPHVKNGISFIAKNYYFYDNRTGSAMNSKFASRYIQQMSLYRKIVQLYGNNLNEKNRCILFLMHLISGMNQSRTAGVAVYEYAQFLKENFEQYQFAKKIWKAALAEFLKNENASALGGMRIKVFTWLCRKKAFSLAVKLL